ncbi:copper resistance protein NlpE N-terminal domain-containing protein [Salinicola avicenniae]|uniref:copper resistance protein NlpE N-terminal domain-containing protein n=1 Tax=Salinicola avicenniae TaxID=2916836 RepID=UPI0020747CCD|nr:MULTISPECIES: copper resistance protein NlpE N-terminal domain-containing protein [unclassified Salinicola]
MKAQSFKALPVVASLLLAACASGPQEPVHYVKATERFTGTLPCPDCQGIDTDLIIKRDAITGAPQGFYLHEQRIDAPGGQRVNTSWGQWSREQDVIDFGRNLYVLRPEVGSARLYTPQTDGALQPLGQQGTPMTNHDGEAVFLQPRIPDLSAGANGSESNESRQAAQ